MKIFGLEIRKEEETTYVLSSRKIRVGDFVLPNPEDYPHWHNCPQEVTLLCKNGDLGLRGCIRVPGKSFKKVVFVFGKKI